MYVRMNEDKNLLITVNTTIYRGETNADLITFLIPAVYEDVNIADCGVLMRYVLPDGTGHSDALVCKPEPYKSHLQFSTPVNTRLTTQEGAIDVWLTAIDINDNVVLKTGEISITVSPSKNVVDYFDKEQIDQLDRIDAEIARLKSAGAEINEVGELLITYADGTEDNLGRVTGDDGAVYVPHVSERKILTFTIEDEPMGVPDEVDLNPHDEWSDVEGGLDGAGVVTSFVWEHL